MAYCERKDSKRLVIDADVARSASQQETDTAVSVAHQCRNLLLTVFTACHSIVMTQAIYDEWQHHQSNFAREWYVRMKRRGHKVVWIKDTTTNERLHQRIRQLADNEKHRDAMLKDVHLLEAALQTDGIIISRDAVRQLFVALAIREGEIRRIIWINPTIDYEQVIIWLNNGAPYDEKRTLGYQQA